MFGAESPSISEIKPSLDIKIPKPYSSNPTKEKHCENLHSLGRGNECEDIEEWSTFLAPEATFLPPNNPKLLTRAEIETFYSNLFEDPLFHLDCEQDSLVVANAEDMAWSTGHCTASLTVPGGKAAHDRNKWAKVWLRQPSGDWQCTMNSWSSTIVQ